MQPARTPASGAATEPAAAGRFVTVRAAGLRLAVAMADVAEIIRPPDLVPVPLAPPSLLGLARRRGVALPVIGLARLLGLGAADDDAAARLVIVRHLGQPVGLAVDALAGMIDAPPERMSPVVDGGRDSDSAIDPDLLLGVLEPGDGAAAVPVLNTAAAIEREFREFGRATPAAPAAGTVIGSSGGGATEPGAAADLRQLVCFEVAGQEFALPVERVREVVPLSRSVTRVPRARPHLLGVATLRGGLMPLVGLRELFALDGAAAAGRSRVVVVRPGEGAAPIGIVVDAVREILRVEAGRIGPVPPLLARDTAFEDMDGIARLDGGRRLVSVLSAERLFRHGAMLAGAADTREDGLTDGGARPDAAAEPHLVVRMAGAEYALPIGSVQEVMRPPESLTPLPGAPDFVDGIVTVRGVVLPVVSPRRLLRLAGGATGGDRPRIVTVASGEVRIGLLVDGVSGILRIPADAIEPAPVLSSAQARLIGRVAALDGRRRTLLLLDTAQLLDLEELAALAAAPDVEAAGAA